jgi:WD40 repeat protein
VLKVLFHPRQLMLFSACDAGEVRAWDLVTKAPAFTLAQVRGGGRGRRGGAAGAPCAGVDAGSRAGAPALAIARTPAAGTAARHSHPLCPCLMLPCRRRRRRHRRCMQAHMSAVPALCLAPDGWHLLSGGRDRVVCVWDVRSGARVATIPVYEALEGAWCVAVWCAVRCACVLLMHST